MGGAAQIAGEASDGSDPISVLEKHHGKNAASIVSNLPEPRMMAGIRQVLERGIPDSELVCCFNYCLRMQCQ